MTDKERVNGYIESKWSSLTAGTQHMLSEAYLAGLEEGRRDSIKAYLAGIEGGRKDRNCVSCSNDLRRENAELKKDKEWLDNTNNEQTQVILKLQAQIESLTEVLRAVSIHTNEHITHNVAQHELNKWDAEEYAIKNVCGYCNRCNSKGYIGCDTYRLSKKAFLDGYDRGEEDK